MNDSVEVHLARLESAVGEITRRMDDQRHDSERRHQENTPRLVRIEEQCKLTNGRVAFAEGDIRRLKEDVASLEHTRKDAITMPSVKVWLAIIAAALSGFWFVMTQLLGYVRP